MKGNAIIGQSGGPTAAINATLAGVIRGCLASDKIDLVYGMKNGIEGLLEERFVLLDQELCNEENLKLLEQTPSAALGSCRVKLPEEKNLMICENGIYIRIFDILSRYNIRYFFYIGGNDSMDTVHKLNDYAKKTGYDIRIIGIPKTIDNDLALTDHTPGFGSAAKYVATTVREIIRDCAVYTMNTVNIIEIMGRNAGWLAAASAIGRVVDGIAPDLVYLAECDFDINTFYNDIKKAFERRTNVVIAVSEGISIHRDLLKNADPEHLDAFGHEQLAGVGKILEHVVKERFDCKVRSIELNVTQRCASHVLSLTDIEEAVSIGKRAVEVSQKGASGVMVAFKRNEGSSYSCDIVCVPVERVANEIKKVPASFINAEQNNVTDECCEYLLPLICGEYPVIWEKGLPKQIIF